MKNQKGQDDSLPYRIVQQPKKGSLDFSVEAVEGSTTRFLEKKTKKSLTPEEALRQVQLNFVVDEFRTQIFEYLLVRASFATSSVEKRAYWILASLLSFVERNKRFPGLKELNQFLKISLGKEGVPQLPPIDFSDLSLQKDVTAEMRVLRTHLEGIDRLRPNPSDFVSKQRELKNSLEKRT